jgi:hypothetical protein
MRKKMTREKFVGQPRNPDECRDETGKRKELSQCVQGQGGHRGLLAGSVRPGQL